MEALSDTRLRGRWSFLARTVAWLVVPFYVASSSANFWLEHRLHLNDQHPAEDALLLVGFGMFAVVGALLVAKRPANLIGWIMVSVALMVGLFPAGDTYAAYIMTTRGHPNALAIAGAWAQGWYWYLLLALSFVYLPLLFPDGRLPSRRWLPVAALAGVGTAVTVILGALTDTLTGQNVPYRIDNPIGIEGLGPVESLPVFGVLGVLLGIGVFGAFASVAVRFRRSRGIERQQLKWFLYAAAFLPILGITDYMPDLINSVVFEFVLIALPSAIGLAILRYRLYDIDIVINRTLVYGILTISLGLCYFGGVVSLQYVFRAITGGKSQLAVVASTLAIAALFVPLRRGVQSLIDRRFYRRKYDAQKTLEDFSARLRDETDLAQLNADLLEVVRDTMQPKHLSLWLRPPHSDRRGSDMRESRM